MRSKTLALGLMAGLVAFGVALAEGDYTPSTRVYGDWAKIDSLSTEQKVELNRIWVEYREKLKALEAERDGKLDAVLNDEQREEIAALRLAEAEKRRVQSRERYRKEQAEDEARDKELEELRKKLKEMEAENKSASE